MYCQVNDLFSLPVRLAIMIANFAHVVDSTRFLAANVASKKFRTDVSVGVLPYVNLAPKPSNPSNALHCGSPGPRSYSAVRSGQAAAKRMILWPGPSARAQPSSRGASASPKHQAAAT
jgi:hypothetical protein